MGYVGLTSYLCMFLDAVCARFTGAFSGFNSPCRKITSVGFVLYKPCKLLRRFHIVYLHLLLHTHWTNHLLIVPQQLDTRIRPLPRLMGSHDGSLNLRSTSSLDASPPIYSRILWLYSLNTIFLSRRKCLYPLLPKITDMLTVWDDLAQKHALNITLLHHSDRLPGLVYD